MSQRIIIDLYDHTPQSEVEDILATLRDVGIDGARYEGEAVEELDWRGSTQWAIVAGREDAIKAYLPENYKVLAHREGGRNGTNYTLIGGTDDRGWTLKDYVLPRLASGLYFGREVSQTGAVNFKIGTTPVDICV